MVQRDIDALIIAPTGAEFSVVASTMLTDAKLFPGLPLLAKKGTIGPHTALCCTSGMGQELAAANITLIAERVKPKFLFVVGCAGGFPGRGVFCGDVVVASVIRSFDYGKLEAGDFNRWDDYDIRCDDGLVQAAEVLAGDSQWQRSVTEPRPDGRAPHEFKVHSKCSIASSDKVVDDPNQIIYATVAKQFPDIHAVEMEGVGAGASANLIHREKGLRFLMIRGISDEPGSTDCGGREHRHAWKRYACATAAAFARTLLTELIASVNPQPLSEFEDPEFQDAIAFFKNGRFSAALESFRSIVRRNPASPESRYYLVLSALAGVRPKLLRAERVAEIDVHLSEARVYAKGKDAHIRYLWAILRQDCYRLNGFHEPAPTTKELLAGDLRLDSLRAREITSAISAPGNEVWESVLKQQNARL